MRMLPKVLPDEVAVWNEKYLRAKIRRPSMSHCQFIADKINALLTKRDAEIARLWQACWTAKAKIDQTLEAKIPGAQGLQSTSSYLNDELQK